MSTPNGQELALLESFSDNFVVIGLCGYARSGKDTFAEIAKECLLSMSCAPFVYSFAHELKREADLTTQRLFNISSFTSLPNEKIVIRPFLVGLGEMCRTVDPFYWVRKVKELAQKDLGGHFRGRVVKMPVIIITDVRFENEAKWIRGHKNGFIIGIDRDGVLPPNDQEAKNIPMLFDNYVNLRVKWCGEKDATCVLTSAKLIGIVEETLRKVLAWKEQTSSQNQT